MKIGYVRVSRHEQNEDMQLDDLHKEGVDDAHIYSDKISGAKWERDGLDKALAFVREGDIFVVWKLDRLGRSLKELIAITTTLKDKGVEFISLKDQIDTTTPNGRLMFHLMGALAEWERDIIRERTLAGLSAARARGRLGGRPRKMTTAKIKRAQELYDSRQLAIAEICKMLGISMTTFYQYVKVDTNKVEARV